MIIDRMRADAIMKNAAAGLQCFEVTLEFSLHDKASPALRHLEARVQQYLGVVDESHAVDRWANEGGQ